MRPNYTLFMISISILLVSCMSPTGSLAQETASAENLTGTANLETQAAELTATTQAAPTLTPAPTNTPAPSPTPFGYYDADRDGLSDVNEAVAGTDPVQADTDGDTLSDYDEATKYFTDPLNADSDRDGKPDNDPEERREYGHTLRAVITIRPPFDADMMTDHYQDVEVIEEGYNLTFQVTFYVNAYHIINEMPLEQRAEWYDGLEVYLAADPFMNFDEQMSSDVWDLLSPEASTDLDIVENMYTWEHVNVEVCPGSKGDSYPEPFLDYFVDSDGQIVSTYGIGLDFIPPDFQYDETWRMEHIVLGREMFYNQTHGSCGSTANFHSTILRSVGIPTRIIQSIPIFNSDRPNQVAMLGELSQQTQTMLQDRMGFNHFVCEAFIGNRWIRVNNRWYEDRPEPAGAFIKIIAFSTWQGVDFATPWGMGGRPYDLLSIEEQEPVHNSYRTYYWE